MTLKNRLKKVLVMPVKAFIPNPRMRGYLRDALNDFTFKNWKSQEQDWIKYENDKLAYQAACSEKRFALTEENLYPILTEYKEQAGGVNDYFWQDLWGAQRIKKSMPADHYDIGSRIDGFLSHLLLLESIKIHMIDIRPLDCEIPGIHFVQGDATNLEQMEDASIESISALCSLEHFGLGRYGDPIDPEACFKAFRAIQRVTKKGGRIYISVPVGKERLCFNAHRVFSAQTIVSEFGDCELEEFSVVDLSADPALITNVDIHSYDVYERDVMGLFLFVKK